MPARQLPGPPPLWGWTRTRFFLTGCPWYQQAEWLLKRARGLNIPRSLVREPGLPYDVRPPSLCELGPGLFDHYPFPEQRRVEDERLGLAALEEQVYPVPPVQLHQPPYHRSVYPLPEEGLVKPLRGDRRYYRVVLLGQLVQLLHGVHVPERRDVVYSQPSGHRVYPVALVLAVG